MTEAAFPLLGTAFIMLCVLPACAMVAKVGLVLLERDEAGGLLHGLDLRYVLLTSSSVLPIAWFLSAGLHQAESGKSVLCFLEHEATLCFEPGFFVAALAVAVLVACFCTLSHPRAVRVASSDVASELMRRLEQLLARAPALADLRGRLVVTDAPGFALATYGLLRPKVFVGTSFAANLSDEMLASALGHEREHVRALDPLRYWVLQLALGVNPVGRALLEPHAARWRAAREAHCDREAVLAGAAPLPLADAIVRAARPRAHEAVALGARDTTLLKLRIGMLLAFAEEPPARCCHRGVSAFPTAVALLLVVLALPHRTGTGVLDALHVGAEQALDYFSR